MKNNDWHPWDIKAALAKRGYCLARISREERLVANVANKVLRYTYRRIERRIGQILGVHPAVIWPSRYAADGSAPARLRKIS